MLAAREARRLDSRPPAERRRPRGPSPRRGPSAPDRARVRTRLRARVLVVGRARLGRILVRVERLDLPARRAPRRARGACPGSARRAGRSGVPAGALDVRHLVQRVDQLGSAVGRVASRKRRSTRRRSPSSSNSSELTSAPDRSTASSTDTARSSGAELDCQPALLGPEALRHAVREDPQRPEAHENEHGRDDARRCSSRRRWPSRSRRRPRASPPSSARGPRDPGG